MKLVRSVLGLALVGLSSTRALDALECWKVQLTNGVSAVSSSKTNYACPIWIGFAGTAPTVNVNEPIQFAWKIVARNASETSNLLQMPAPPGVTFSTTYVRGCPDTGSCDPTTPASPKATAPLAAFPGYGISIPAKSTGDFKFATPGVHTVSAQIEVLDAADPQTSYVFAGYTNVTVTSSAARKSRTVVCRQSTQSATEPLAQTKSKAFGEVCDLSIDLNAVPVAHPNAPSSVSWSAKIAPQTGSAFSLPTTVNGKPYDVASATVKVCKDVSKCDEYTSATDLLATFNAGPTSFNADTAKFLVEQVSFTTEGTFTAFLHVVLSGETSTRYDFMYYFEVVSSKVDAGKAIASKNFTTDGTSVYCWKTLAAADDADVTSSSVVAGAENTDCPYGLQLSLSSKAPAIGDAVSANWIISENMMFSASKIGNVTLSPVYDKKTQADVTLPVVNLYQCNGTCSPFSAATTKTLLFASPATNMSESDKTTGSYSIKFTEAGTYTIMAHVITADDSDRIDTVVYSKVTVAAADSNDGKSSTLLYIVLGLGAIVFIAVVVYTIMWFRRSRDRERMERMAEAFKVFHTSNVPTSIHTEDHYLDPAPMTLQGNHDFVLSEESPAEVDDVDSLSFDAYGSETTDGLGLADMSVNSSKLSFAFSESERGSEFEAYDV